MTTTPSHRHKTRKAHNWLIYKNIDNNLISHQSCIKGTIYDLGCGEMPYRNWFLQRADSYVGVDWSDTQHSLTADIVENLNERLSIDSGVADLVISLSVLEHLCTPQIMLEEAYRILRDDGHIMLQVPWQWYVHEAPHDYFRYTPYGLRFLLENAGFKDVHIESQGGFFTMLFLKLNYFSLRLIRGPKAMRWLLRVFFGIFWYTGQTLAPLLDKLDGHWSRETSGYFATGRKPCL